MRRHLARFLHRARNQTSQVICEDKGPVVTVVRPFSGHYTPPPYVPTPDEAAAIAKRNALTAGALLAAVAGAYYASRQKTFFDDSSHQRQSSQPQMLENQHLINWSGTHECTVGHLYQPESLDELETVVREAHLRASKLRCIGSGLSPNGIAFQSAGMVSLALMDKVCSVDPNTKRVTVQAGARVQDVADALRAYGLTLANYASIREQTIGGFTQVSAHGTGAALPPVDETIVAMKLVTPAEGTLELSRDKDPELFALAKVGLGCLGIVAEVTLQAVPAHKLKETTIVTDIATVKRHHAEWLRDHKHLRYMWIPYTDAVVVVFCDEIDSDRVGTTQTSQIPLLPADASKPLKELAVRSNVVPANEVDGLSATQLRDALLAKAPLNPRWVRKVNAAEAEYWRNSQGTRVGWSDEILGFDCGGEQWVLEVVFDAGMNGDNMKDIRFMEELMEVIRKHDVPAPAPIEQRWTAASSSPMSPSYAPPPTKLESNSWSKGGSSNTVFSWVGIIMYLSSTDGAARSAVTEAFRKYAGLVETKLMHKYGAVEHWAKIELPSEDDAEGLKRMKARLAGKYPIEEFELARRRLDPRNILGNDLVDTLLTC
jgi:L-galactono-1,4-lactone dehydrogenase